MVSWVEHLVIGFTEWWPELSFFSQEFNVYSALSVSLVTADKAVLKAFPDRALTMEEFVSR